MEDQREGDSIALIGLTPSQYAVLAAYPLRARIYLLPSGLKQTASIPFTELESLIDWLRGRSEIGWFAGPGKRVGAMTKAVRILKERLSNYLSPEEYRPVLQKKPRPRTVQGRTIQMPTQTYGYLYFIFNWVDGKPFEIFAYIGKNGSDHQATAEGVCRLASLAFQYGIDAEEVADQLRGIQSSTPEWSKGEQIKSLEDAVSKAIRQGLEAGDPAQNIAI